MSTTIQEKHEPAPADGKPVNPDVAGAPDRPISIYEVHLASWMRVPEENRTLTFSEIAPKLSAHAHRLGFTHVHLHVPDNSDSTGFGFLIEHLHKQELGVILDSGQPCKTPTLENDQTSPDGQCQDGKTRLSGADYQWDRGWTEDTMSYFATDPLYRKFRQDQFRKRDSYAFEHHFILPLSRLPANWPRSSLFATMPGDLWQRFANLRLLFAYTFLLPGKKLLFMGDEFGQCNPWQSATSLDWHLLNQFGFHHQLMSWTTALNRFYRGEKALHQTDSIASGFQWIDTSDAECSVVSFLRKSADTGECLLVVLNFTPVPRHNYRIGVPCDGVWQEKLNSDATEYGGSGQGNLGEREAAPFGWNFQSHSLILTLPSLAAIVLKAAGPAF